MSIEQKHKSHTAAKLAGWFSRRHDTDEAAKVEKEKTRAKKGGNLKKDNRIK